MDDAYHRSARYLYVSNCVYVNNVYPTGVDYGSLSLYGNDSYDPGWILMRRGDGLLYEFNGYLPDWVYGSHNGDGVVYVWDTLPVYPDRSTS